jgi:hypothetical protein
MSSVNLDKANPEVVAAALENNKKRLDEHVFLVENVDNMFFKTSFVDPNIPSSFDNIVEEPPTVADYNKISRMVETSFNNGGATARPKRKINFGLVSEERENTVTKEKQNRAFRAAANVTNWPSLVRATIDDLSNLDAISGTSTRQRIKRVYSGYRWVPFFAGWVILLVVLCLLRYCAFK